MKSLKDTISESMQINESAPMVVLAQADLDQLDISVSNGVKVFASQDPDSGTLLLYAMKNAMEFLNKYNLSFDSVSEMSKAAGKMNSLKIGASWSHPRLGEFIRVY